MDKELKLGSLDIKMSTMLKGLAILLMVIHHTFGFPSDWLKQFDFSSVSILGEPINEWIRWATKICVAIFAFVTGYAYFFNKTPTIKYSLKKIWNLLTRYWFILFIIFVPLAIYIGASKVNLKVIAYNIFGLDQCLIPFAWYVYFYIFAMLTMPFIIKCFNGRWMSDFIIPVATCACLYNLLEMTKLSSELRWIKVALTNIFLYMPCLIYGFLFAKYNMFEKVDKIFKPKYIWQAILIIIIIFGCGLTWHYIKGINLYTIYTPILIYEFMIIINNLKHNFIPKIFEFLGKHSLNIWFLHALFLSKYTRKLVQPIGFWPKNPVLIIIWEILLCIPISMLINLIFDKSNKLISIYKNRKEGKIN